MLCTDSTTNLDSTVSLLDFPPGRGAGDMKISDRGCVFCHPCCVSNPSLLKEFSSL